MAGAKPALISVSEILEICAADALAKVAALHVDLAAHLLQARSHALSDAITKRLVACCSPDRVAGGATRR